MLGGLELNRDGKRLMLPPTAASRSLLAYLIFHHNRVHRRETLAELFWPERPRERSLRNLSTALWHIRHCLAPEKYLLTEAQTLQFDSTRDIWLDVEELNSKGKEAHHPSISREERILFYERCVQLYRGDFLEGNYDDWCLEERYSLEETYLNILSNLVELYENKNQLREALRCAELLLKRDPLREEWTSTAVRLHVLLQQRREALRLARHCRAILQRELKTEPSSHTIAVFNQYLGTAWRMDDENDQENFPCVTRRSYPEHLLEHPPFVGRETEWEFLLKNWEQAKSGNGALILVGGEAGIGKTRLVGEFGDYVRQTGGIIGSSGCYQFERTLPHALLTDLIRNLLEPNKTWLIKQIPHHQRIELGRLLPELGESPLPSATSPNKEDQIRLFDTAIEFFIELAHHKPLLIILEDIHWASDMTLTWLHRLARRLVRNPILVMATYRREEVHPGSLLDNWMLHLKQNKLSNQLELKPLSRSAMEDWLFTAEDTLLNRIHNWSDGNPFFALETLRVLFEKGLLQIVNGQLIESPRSTSWPIPASVKQAISMHLDQFTSFTHKAADAAAVIGHAFDFELLQTVLEQDEDTTLEALDNLLRGYIIHEQTNFPGQDYVFEHHLVREVILERLHPKCRQRYHRQIAKALTARSLTQPRLNSEIAFHFESGGEFLPAISYYKQAAQDAANTFAWQDVERIQGKILEIITRLDPVYKQPELLLQRGEALTERAYLRFIQGRMNERDKDIEELHRLVEGSSSDALSLLYLIQQARYRNLDGHYGQALEVTEEGLKLAERLNDSIARCHFLAQAGFAHYFRGEYPLALTTLQSALPLCPENSSLRGETLSVLAYASYLISDFKTSLEYRQQALQIHSALGENDQVAIDLTDMGILYIQLNRFPEADYYLKKALTLAHEVGSQVAESYATNNLGNLEYICGRYSVALDYFSQSLNLQRATGSRRGEASALSNMGMTLAAIGDYGNAETLLRQAISIQEEINYPSGLASGLTYLARILTNLEKYDDALQSLRRAHEISQRIGDFDAQNAVLLSLSWFCLKQGKFEEAQQIAVEALSIAEAHNFVDGSILAQTLLGLARLGCCAGDEAYACTTQALTLLEEQGYIEGAEEAIYLAHYLVLLSLNRAAEATFYLQKFHEEVNLKADNIRNSEQRRLYLQNWSDLSFHL